MIAFSKREREIIAEFIFSFHSDILIVSDATKLLQVLCDNKIISDESTWLGRINNKDLQVIYDLIDILKEKISEDQWNQIMSEYQNQQ